MSIKCWLAVAAPDAERALAKGTPGAWLFYRIGENGSLQRASNASQTRGGLMGIIDGAGLGAADLEKLANEIAMECSRRAFQGVLLDFTPAFEAQSAMSELSRLLRGRAVEHFAAESLAACAPEAKLIIPSALSGGSFDEMLARHTARYGAQNLCLEIVRMRHDFQMPALSPEGTPLSAQKFEEILSQSGGSAFFSPEMQCKYFTYRDGESVHFVLFDDEHSCASKIARAEAAGFYGAFMLLSEWT